MVIERYRQERERQQREAYKQTPEGIPPALKEILSNPVYSEMLNSLLEQNNEIELRNKIATKQQLTEDEFKILDNYRVKIKEAIDASKDVLSIIEEKPERIELIASRSPEFARIVGRLGASETLDFLKKYMALIYVKSPTSFSDLRSKIENIRKAEQDLRNIEQTIRDFAISHKIPMNIVEQFYKMAAEDITTAEQLFVNNIRRNLSLIGKIRDFIGERRFSEEYAEKLNRIKDINELLEEINKNLGEIGNMIAGAINSVGSAELSRALYGERIEQPTFSFKDAGALIEQYGNEENLEREWGEYLREQLAEGEDWNNIKQQNPNRANIIRKGFVPHLKKKQRKIGGLLDWLLGDNGPLGQIVNGFLQNK